MLLEKLVEQHCVHLIIAHAVGFSFLVERYKLGVDFSYFFGDQAESWTACCVVRVAKGHRLKCQASFAGFGHRLNIILETLRRCQGADLSMDINRHGKVVGSKGFLENVADVATIGYVHTVNADTNRVTGGSNIRTGVDPQGDIIAAANVINERISADGCIVKGSLV